MSCVLLGVYVCICVGLCLLCGCLRMFDHGLPVVLCVYVVVECDMCVYMVVLFCMCLCLSVLGLCAIVLSLCVCLFCCLDVWCLLCVSVCCLYVFA